MTTAQELADELNAAQRKVWLDVLPPVGSAAQLVLVDDPDHARNVEIVAYVIAGDDVRLLRVRDKAGTFEHTFPWSSVFALQMASLSEPQ